MVIEVWYYQEYVGQSHARQGPHQEGEPDQRGAAQEQEDVRLVLHIHVVVVVYHVTIVAVGHGLLKKFWPRVMGCVHK